MRKFQILKCWEPTQFLFSFVFLETPVGEPKCNWGLELPHRRPPPSLEVIASPSNMGVLFSNLLFKSKD